MKQPERRQYQWPPPEEPYEPKERNAIHSVLTALPVIMLVAGLVLYFKGESEQTNSPPVQALSKTINGFFTGLSVIKSGGNGQHYLWIDQQGKTSGFRIRSLDVSALESLVRESDIRLKAAPTVEGSRVYWAWFVEQNGEVYLDRSADLR